MGTQDHITKSILDHPAGMTEAAGLAEEPGGLELASGRALGVFLEGTEASLCAAHTPQACEASLVRPASPPSSRSVYVLCTRGPPPASPQVGV